MNDICLAIREKEKEFCPIGRHVAFFTPEQEYDIAFEEGLLLPELIFRGTEGGLPP